MKSKLQEHVEMLSLKNQSYPLPFTGYFDPNNLDQSTRVFVVLGAVGYNEINPIGFKSGNMKPSNTDFHMGPCQARWELLEGLYRVLYVASRATPVEERYLAVNSAGHYSDIILGDVLHAVHLFPQFDQPSAKSREIAKTDKLPKIGGRL